MEINGKMSSLNGIVYSNPNNQVQGYPTFHGQGYNMVPQNYAQQYAYAFAPQNYQQYYQNPQPQMQNYFPHQNQQQQISNCHNGNLINQDYQYLYGNNSDNKNKGEFTNVEKRCKSKFKTMINGNLEEVTCNIILTNYGDGRDSDKAEGRVRCNKCLKREQQEAYQKKKMKKEESSNINFSVSGTSLNPVNNLCMPVSHNPNDIQNTQFNVIPNDLPDLSFIPEFSNVDSNVENLKRKNIELENEKAELIKKLNEAYNYINSMSQYKETK